MTLLLSMSSAFGLQVTQFSFYAIFCNLYGRDEGNLSLSILFAIVIIASLFHPGGFLEGFLALTV